MEFFLDLNWWAVGQIILIDILLGGDNAIVIALACRNLPPHLRLRGIVWGTIGAVGIRVALLAFAVTVLQLAYVKLAGGILLLWIAYRLLKEDGNAHDAIPAAGQLLTAIGTIMIADLVMSMDNVLAVASAAQQAEGQNQLVLVIFGILVSIPVVVWGSTLVLKLMQKFLMIITLGAALLGYLGAAMACTDVALLPFIAGASSYLFITIPLLGVKLSVPGLLGAFAIVICAIGVRHRKTV
ncbi:TerC family protein [Undibacterium sp. TJN25]|uniref:TerC family protein n=1 Tax=Undibacterium sp. TJN25 TaxID=3413056 RepID=UPI003BEF7CA3